MQSNAQFWAEQGEAWKPMNAKEKKKVEKKEPNLEAGATEDAPLVVSCQFAILRSCVHPVAVVAAHSG